MSAGVGDRGDFRRGVCLLLLLVAVIEGLGECGSNLVGRAGVWFLEVGMFSW